MKKPTDKESRERIKGIHPDITMIDEFTGFSTQKDLLQGDNRVEPRELTIDEIIRDYHITKVEETEEGLVMTMSLKEQMKKISIKQLGKNRSQAVQHCSRHISYNSECIDCLTKSIEAIGHILNEYEDVLMELARGNYDGNIFEVDTPPAAVKNITINQYFGAFPGRKEGVSRDEWLATILTKQPWED